MPPAALFRGRMSNLSPEAAPLFCILNYPSPAGSSTRAENF